MNRNSSSVAEMNDKEFKQSLDDLIGDLDDPSVRLSPPDSANSRSSSPYCQTAAAVGSGALKPQQQNLSSNGYQQFQGNQQPSQLTMNLVAGTMFPLNNASQHLMNLGVSPLSASFVRPTGHVVSSYNVSSTASSLDGSHSQYSDHKGKRRKRHNEDPEPGHGGGRKKRKEERNAREQRRSQQIVDQIANLRDLLNSSGMHAKRDKYSTLVTAASYIRQLQQRSSLLESEQKKLLVTMGQTSNMANNKYIPVSSTSEGEGSSSLEASTSATNDVSPSTDEESPVYVSGLDYRSVFLACPVAGAITSIDGRFLDCNRDFEEVTGYTKDELFRKPVATTPFDPGERHLSLFNVLKREDMERLFVVMSDMLRKPAVTSQDRESDSEPWDTDRWSDRVALNRKEGMQVSRNTHRRVGRAYNIMVY